MAYKSSDIKRVQSVGPSCRKKMYNSFEEAQEMIRHIKETRVTRDLHAYKCIICGCWHLTSRPGS